MSSPEIGLQIFVRRAESPIYNSPMATPWGNRQTHRMCALKGQCKISKADVSIIILKENGVEYNEDYRGRKIYIALSGRKWYRRFIKSQGDAIGL
jgi:hypothetical protein